MDKDTNPNANESEPDTKPGPKPNVFLAAVSPTAIPEAYDIPISLVNRVLYVRPGPDPSFSTSTEAVSSGNRSSQRTA